MTLPNKLQAVSLLSFGYVTAFLIYSELIGDGSVSGAKTRTWNVSFPQLALVIIARVGGMAAAWFLRTPTREGQTTT
jgi:hypothetical protein